MSVILASSSPYRRRLLARLLVDFDCESPQVDETPLPGETAEFNAVFVKCCPQQFDFSLGAAVLRLPAGQVVACGADPDENGDYDKYRQQFEQGEARS